jgi:hypothetical protein
VRVSRDRPGTAPGPPDPKEKIDRMIEIVMADRGRFRSLSSQFPEEMLKQAQRDAWDNQI